MSTTRGRTGRPVSRTLPLLLATAFALAASPVGASGATGTATSATGGHADGLPAAATPAATSAVILVAGDIAGCSYAADSATARLIADREGIVMTAGDNAYDLGTLATYRACYGPTWGRFLERTHPVPGNHDYATVGAADYFTYFGRRAGPEGRGYYAFMAGSWRVYALDSDCAAGGGCRRGTAQYRWLKADLAAHPTACSMAVMHHPTFSSGPHSNHVDTVPLVSLLHRAGVEIIVNGHDHIYERFAPARPWGKIDAEHGIRQFIVGTGGAGLYPFRSARPPHSQKRQNRVHGVLRLELGADGYAWRFLPVRRGSFRDRGTGPCHAPGSSMRTVAEPEMRSQPGPP